MNSKIKYLEVLKDTKLIAILRGIKTSEVLEVVKILVKSGFRLIEVPLNSPNAFKSIEILSKYYKNSPDILIGAGTVCNTLDVEKLEKINNTLIISPNVDIDVINKTNELNMISISGFLTPSEAYMAINAGVKSLKLFPFDTFGISYFKSIKVILPLNIPVIAVGGIDEHNIKQYLENGVEYFGIGSSLYKPNISLDTLKKKADFFIKTINNNI